MSWAPRVLVVDDEQTLATNLAFILRNNGFEAVPAFSGPEALKFANSRPFDVLLTDAVMSPIDGVRTAIAFRNINPSSRVYILSDKNDVAQQLLLRANLAWDFPILPKPIDTARLIETLRTMDSD